MHIYGTVSKIFSYISFVTMTSLFRKTVSAIATGSILFSSAPTVFAQFEDLDLDREYREMLSVCDDKRGVQKAHCINRVLSRVEGTSRQRRAIESINRKLLCEDLTGAQKSLCLHGVRKRRPAQAGRIANILDRARATGVRRGPIAGVRRRHEAVDRAVTGRGRPSLRGTRMRKKASIRGQVNRFDTYQQAIKDCSEKEGRDRNRCIRSKLRRPGAVRK